MTSRIARYAVLTALCLATAERPLMAAQNTVDWPHWRGPNRNGIVAEGSGWERGNWPPHVALARGRLYCKDRHGNLKCFSLRPDEKGK